MIRFDDNGTPQLIMAESIPFEGRLAERLTCRMIGHYWMDGPIPPMRILTTHYRYWFCSRCGAETDRNPEK